MTALKNFGNLEEMGFKPLTEAPPRVHMSKRAKEEKAALPEQNKVFTVLNGLPGAPCFFSIPWIVTFAYNGVQWLFKPGSHDLSANGYTRIAFA
ncbi:MAG: hypothetical protein ABA06_03275 [Parcubacteria bacterium C7867-001]|nr:MAG: hypothetical protein ABA06_03275 [Parcubacteria bacterium C7867-001]